MRILLYIGVVVGYVLLGSLSFWMLGLRSKRPTRERVAALLQIVAIYTLVMGLVAKAGVFDTFEWLGRDLTSPNPLRFLVGNFFMFAIIFSAASVALDPASSSSFGVFVVGLPVLLTGFLLLCVYVVFHLAVVVPVAYGGYLVAAIPIHAILHASGDVVVSAGDRSLSIKQLVADNQVAITNFVVSLPAFVLGSVLKIVPVIGEWRKK